MLECPGPSLESHHLVAVPARGPHDPRPGQRAPSRICPAEHHEPIAITTSRARARPKRPPPRDRVLLDPIPTQARANNSVPHGCNRAAAAVSLAPSESVPRGTRAVSAPRAVRWALLRRAHPTFKPSRATSDPAQRASACQGRPPDLPASRAFAPRSAKRPPPRHSVRPGTDPDPGPRLRHCGLRHWPTHPSHILVLDSGSRSLAPYSSSPLAPFLPPLPPFTFPPFSRCSRGEWGGGGGGRGAARRGGLALFAKPASPLSLLSLPSFLYLFILPTPFIRART